MSLPERDQLSLSKMQLESRLAIMFGGRIAEELVFGKENVTTGAANDIQQATGLARRMITEFGFSDKLGRLRYADNEEEIFLGHSVATRKNMSDSTAHVIDEEVRRLIDEAEARARQILTEHRKDLDTLANALLEYETLSGDEVRALLRGEPIVRPDEDMPAPRDVGRKSPVPTAGKGREPRRGFGPEPQTEP
jgi:cell division protease FtsH